MIKIFNIILIVIVVPLMLSVSCDKPQTESPKDFSSDIARIDEKDKEQDERIADIELKIKSLLYFQTLTESNILDIKSKLTLLESNNSLQNDELAIINQSIREANIRVDGNVSQDLTQQEMINLLQSNLTSLQSKVALNESNVNSSILSLINSNMELSGQVHNIQESYITGYYDPCGDDPNRIDEILFKTSDNKYIAYFEDSSGNRRLSILTSGNYRTTDGTNCNFTVR